MYRVIKRGIDFFVCTFAVVLLLPIFLIIAIAIKLDSSGPVIFKQKRAGLNMEPFYIYKFRTMYIDAPSNSPTYELDNAEKYITRIGKLLRVTSLDELPQIINILKGDMSIVGPRPVIYDERILLKKREQKNIHSLVPGITGWAQINGRDELGINKKVQYDYYYLENISLKLDIKIMLLTISKVIKKEGILDGEYHDTSSTQEVI